MVYVRVHFEVFLLLEREIQVSRKYITFGDTFAEDCVVDGDGVWKLKYSVEMKN